ncbi:DUF5995 family protein [Mycobacterium kyorinense]|uniref:Uncharacterized protein n=1 Tax=Mycobacterium kyorinense TaxID=487514 RepID=A0A1X1XH32_9MYCO|nr:DUF5995 family protein [Mycobacterium kyorinense]ORV98063.1 hypothetical protein AWC14_14070 [Mycobacterium kyorinense]
MAVPLSTPPPGPLPRLPEPTSVDDVARNLDRIIDWSINAESTIGYFAVLYKRATFAVRQGLQDGAFKDPQQMQRFDLVFAKRYFDALNAYFHPHAYHGVTAPWEVSFVGQADSDATMIQHMMTGLNAHICFDLGVSAATVAPHTLQDLEPDFFRVNALLGSQVPGLLDIIEKLSPEFRRIRWLVPNETFWIRRLIVKFRTGAWWFAVALAENPAQAKQKMVNQSAWTSALGAWYLDPPEKWRPFHHIVNVISKRESHNVGANIAALAGIAEKPHPLIKKLL